jgi:hypothetical protein
LIAGAIRDSKRGQVIGTTTFGNGSIQKLIPMDDGSALLIAVARYYTPNGKDIEEVGVETAGSGTGAGRRAVGSHCGSGSRDPCAPKKGSGDTEDRQLTEGHRNPERSKIASRPA